MTLSQAINHFHTQSRVAEVLGLSRARITFFKQNGGLPFNKQCVLEKKTNGKLKARREDDPDNPFFSTT